ncbi:MAG TPA: cytochrome c biogenesis protein ResB [Syntrophales bacterium]|nr:cytochrome c biogenesis protein ResB [Syntrophales bacterium]
MRRRKISLRSLLSSVKLTIALFIIISVASILGTVIPQQEADIIAGRFSPGMVSICRELQLFNIYHSTWFIGLMLLLSINLVVCSANRLPASWKLYRKVSAPDEAEIFANLPSDRVFLVERHLEEEAERLEVLLKKKYKGIRRKYTEEGTFINSEKGRFSHLGVYVVHLGVLIILTGMIIGFFFGFDAYVDLAEGEAVDRVKLQGKTDFRKLDFAVRCDRFSIDYYEDGTPKVYRSDLTFLRNGNILQQRPIFVNHPATVEGIRFYQANFGTVPSYAVIGIRKGRDKSLAVKAHIGTEFDLPGNDGRAKILRMEENFMRMGPAVKIGIQSAKGNFQFWVFQDIEQIMEENPGLIERAQIFNPGIFTPYVFSLAMIQTKNYTGLQITRDPGVPVVVAGSFLLVFGFMIVFFCSHLQIWIRIDMQGKNTRISIAGKTNKDTVGLNREIAHLVEKI